MGKSRTDKGRVIDDAFRQEAVRILAASGRTIREVADELGVGASSLGAWKRKLYRAELMAGPHGRDCGRPPTSCRSDATRARRRAPTAHSAGPLDFPRKSGGLFW